LQILTQNGLKILRTEAINLSEQILGKRSLTLASLMIFVHMTPKPQTIKAKLSKEGKEDYQNLKGFAQQRKYSTN
jgi:hypothetical protein